MASVTVPILGHRIEIASRDPRVLGLAVDAFGVWCRLPPHLVSSTEPARVDIEVREGGEAADLAPEAEWNCQGAIFEGRMGATRVRIDVGARAAHCVTQEAALRDPDWFSWHVLAPARLLATLDDRLPIHAAGIIRGERLALLMGPSGSGKSTTAYACDCAGLDVLSEDTAFFSRRAGRIWGLADKYFLAPDADRWFPELVGSSVRRRPNGKLRRVVSAHRRSPRFSVQGEPVVVLLDRSSDALAERIGSAEWHAHLERPLEIGFDLYAEAWTDARTEMRSWAAFRVSTRLGPHVAAAAIADLLARHM